MQILINLLQCGLLALLAWRFLPRLGRGAFFLCLFAFFLVARFYTLTDPFYGDAIGGPLAEALWLADHNFDFRGLMQQPPYQAGGPRVYLFSIYPSFLALTLKFIGNVTALLVFHHVLVFAMAACIITLFREWGRRLWPAPVPELTAVLIASLPLFQSQMQAINMEMPALLFCVLTLHYLIRDRPGAAAVSACLAAAVKGHGLIACGTVAVMGLCSAVRSRTLRTKVRNTGLALLCVVVAGGKVLSKFLLGDQHANEGLIAPMAGWPSFPQLSFFYLYGVILIVLAVEATARFYRREKLNGEETVYRRTEGILLLYVSFWFLLFLNFQAVSPRYRLLVLPVVVFLGVSVLFRRLGSNRLRAGFLVGLIVFSSLCSRGWLHYPAVSHDHVILERSLEYRDDLKFNRKWINALTEEYSGFTVGAPFLFAQMLAIPEAGYVDEPLDVVVYGMPVRYENIKIFEGLGALDIMHTIWVGHPSHWSSNADFPYPVHPRDNVIETFDDGRHQVTFFKGGLAIEIRRQIIQRLRREP